MRNPPIVEKAAFGLRRRGAGRWGIPVAAFTSVAMTVGVSTALTINRIDHGTAADWGRPTVTSAPATASAGAAAY